MGTRDEDLKELAKLASDKSLPAPKREGVRQIMAEVARQTKDRELERLRANLIGATKAKDKRAIWKYQSLIKAHLKEDRLERPW